MTGGKTSAIIALLAVIGGSAYALSGRAAGTDMIAAGRQIYAANCASCHGANLEGEKNWKQRKPDGKLPAPPHDESGHTWHHDDELLFAITKFGVAKAAGLADYASDMPAYEGVLTDDQIRAVLAYIESAWPEPIRGRRNAMRGR